MYYPNEQFYKIRGTFCSEKNESGDSILIKKDGHVLLKVYFNESEKSLFIFL